MKVYVAETRICYDPHASIYDTHDEVQFVATTLAKAKKLIKQELEDHLSVNCGYVWWWAIYAIEVDIGELNILEGAKMYTPDLELISDLEEYVKEKRDNITRIL